MLKTLTKFKRGPLIVKAPNNVDCYNAIRRETTLSQDNFSFVLEILILY